MRYRHSTVSIARPASGVEFSIAKLMLTPSFSPGLLCSWITGQRQRWLSRMLTDIHSRGRLSHLIAKVPLSFFPPLIHMEHKYLPILFPKTSIYIPSSRLFFHESYNCAPDHFTKPLATFHELVSSWSFGTSPSRQKQTDNYPDWSFAFHWKTSPYAQRTGRLNKNERWECGAQKDVLRVL